MKDLKFNEQGLLPAVIQDAQTGQVLMLAYMNKEALDRTLSSGETWFYSRSRETLWHKGETSGHTQKVHRIYYDCDGDTLLLLVDQCGAACHNGTASCFYRTLSGTDELPSNNFLPELERIIAGRRVERPDGSYVVRLFDKGLDKILKKVGEEASEVIIAAKNEERYELIYEAGDLIFHLLVLLAQKDVALSEVLAELASRHTERKEAPDA